jgi:hypothetical protein
VPYTNDTITVYGAPPPGAASVPGGPDPARHRRRRLGRGLLRPQPGHLLQHPPRHGQHVRRARRLATERGRRRAGEPALRLPQRQRRQVLRQLADGRVRRPARVADAGQRRRRRREGMQARRGREWAGALCAAGRGVHEAVPVEPAGLVLMGMWVPLVLIHLSSMRFVFNIIRICSSLISTSSSRVLLA